LIDFLATILQAFLEVLFVVPTENIGMEVLLEEVTVFSASMTIIDSEHRTLINSFLYQALKSKKLALDARLVKSYLY
jgi:rRNA-processing protein FCF1